MKKYLSYIFILAALIAGGGYYWYGKTKDERSKAENTVLTSTVSNPEIIKVTGVEGKTALAVLKERHKVDEKNTSYGIFIDGIDGKKGDEAHFWAFYINGTSASLGADSYISKTGDELEFRYESFK